MDDKLISYEKNNLVEENDDAGFNVNPGKMSLSPMADFGRR
jgi:hypothetical protein